jgi:hypothetical protein
MNPNRTKRNTCLKLQRILIDQSQLSGIGCGIVGVEVEEFYVYWFQVSGFKLNGLLNYETY